MIDRLRLENFTAFKEIDIAFSSGINVIIGENGTGKTHLLKAAYSLCSAKDPTHGLLKTSPSAIEVVLTDKIVGVFKPLNDELSELHRQGASDRARLEGHFTFKRSVVGSFERGSTSIQLDENVEYEHCSWESVFIPAKEVLSFMEGFNSLYHKYELSFDETYHDICAQLELPKIRHGELREVSTRILAKLEEICGGRFIFQGGGKVTFKSASGELSANAVAEGFRKFGMLARILETLAIVPNATGPLFWDEPESNLNPILMRKLVEILLELSRNGQQVILATHDYVLLKWIDLLRGKDDKVHFHSLYRDAETNTIKLSSTDDFLQIAPNPIDEAFGDLIDREIADDMKGLGQ